MCNDSWKNDATNANAHQVLTTQVNTALTNNERPGIMREGALAPKGFDLQPKVTDLSSPQVVFIRRRYIDETNRLQFSA